MTQVRKNQMIGAIVTLAAAAALATSLMSAAGAAPPNTKKHAKVTVIHHKKPIYVKMVGDRRAAENFAEQAYADILAQRQAAIDAAQAQARANRDNNAAAIAAQEADASAWASSAYYPYAVPAISPNAFPGVVNPVNVVPLPYGGVQTITIPGNINGGAPTVNNFGSYGNGYPFANSYSIGNGFSSAPAQGGGFYNLTGSFYNF